MRDLIVEELSVGAPPEQAARAKKLIARPGNIAQHLLDAGFGPRDVLQACCAATGLPPAPLAWLRDPKPPSIPGVDEGLCRRVGAAPASSQAGRLCIAYADPEVALRAAELPFPKHQPYLALPGDVDRVIGVLARLDDDDVVTRATPTHRTPGVEDESNLFDDEPATTADTRAVDNPPAVRAPSDQDLAAVAAIEGLDGLDDLPPLEDDEYAGDTVVSAPIHMTDEGAPSPPTKVVRREPLADALTVNAADDPARVPGLPSAPKPPRRQQTAGAGELDDAPTAQAARPPASSLPSNVPPPARVAAGGSPPPPSSARRAPGSAPAPGAASFADADVETRRSEPKRAPSLATPPRGTDASGAHLEQMPMAAETLVTSGPPVDTRARKPSPPVAPRPQQREPAPTVHVPAPPSATLSDPNGTDTQQQALAILSREDLDVSDEGGPVDAPAPSRAAPPRAAGRPPTNEGPDATHFAKAQTPPPIDAESAFASASSAQDQEAVQQQKQRLKRIAQIASIKRYKIDRVLGRGGMATVYFATDTKTGEPCALKLMEPHLADDAVFVERFKREIRASISLNHKNIVRVFDYGEENGTYYMTSEFVDGGTVAALLKQLERPLPVGIVVPLMWGFLDGLQHAHEQGFVHRDLKPANLMLTRSGVIKIGDFGIAKAQTDSTLTKTGALFGTPAYMSPEQAQGQELDARSDLFGAGIIFYELLAGYNPYAHENPSTTMFAIAKGQARPLFDANPTVPEAVERVVQRLLEKDRAKRYQSAAEARDDLRAMFDLVSEKHPGAVSRALEDLGVVVDELNHAQSVLESQRAGQLLQRKTPEHAEAAFRFYKATLLDPQNFDAVNGLAQLRADYGFRFTRPDDKQMLELEQSLEKKAEQPAVLRRLAELSATHRNLVDMAGFMKRYLRLMPTDTHVQHKLERIVGADPHAPYSMLPLELATNRTEQWTASDEMVETARAAGADEGSDAGKSGVRPAAKVRAAAVPGASSKSGPQNVRRDGPPTPATASSASGETTSPNAARGSSEKSGAGRSAEEAPAPEPKDSFEALVRFARGLLEDTVRSLTGDQGIDAVKEIVSERFGEGRGELKDVVKGALGKGKDAVADGLLKKEGREAIQRTLKDNVRRHWRLAATVLFAWIILFGLGKACSLACSDAPPPPPPPAVSRTAGLDDDTRGDNKADAKAAANDDGAKAATPPSEAPAAGAGAGAPPPPAEEPQLSPEEAARLMAEKPKEAAPAPLDAKQELAQKQEELKKRAKAEPDAAKAVELYTQAIDTDPYASGARGALLERARLHMAGGELDQAESDLFRLQRRPDYSEVQAEVEPMFEDIKKARKALEPPPPPPE